MFRPSPEHHGRRGFVLYGEAVAKTVNEIDPELELEPRNTSGSIENIRLLEEIGVR